MADAIQQSSRTDLEPKADQFLLQRQECAQKGGRWDDKTQTCIMPPGAFNLQATTNTEETQEIPKLKGAVEAFVDSETGAPTGFTTKKGMTFFGGTPDQINEAMTREQGSQLAPGINQVGTAQAQAQQQFAMQQAIGSIGQVGGLTAIQEAETKFGQAAMAGLANLIPGALGGAAAGAIAGGSSTLGIGTVPGAIGGAVIGGVGAFLSGTIANIKTQQRGEIGGAKKELTAARTNMRQLAVLASNDPANADYYISLYNQQLTRIYQARRKVKVETSGNLNSWIEDGTVDLAEFDAFLRPGGAADIYGQKLQQALISGVPLSLTGDQFFSDEEDLNTS